MFNLDNEKLTQIAMEYDPVPVLMAFNSIPQGNFLTQPNVVPPGQGASFESIVNGGLQPGPGQAPGTNPAAPLDPRMLGLLAQMNPSAQNQPRAAAVAPQRPGQVQLQPVAQPAARPMSLAQILGR